MYGIYAVILPLRTLSLRAVTECLLNLFSFILWQSSYYSCVSMRIRISQNTRPNPLTGTTNFN